MKELTKQEKLNALLCLQKEFETGSHDFICTALGLIGYQSMYLSVFLESLVLKQFNSSLIRYWGCGGSISHSGNLLFHPKDKQSRIDLINKWISEYK